MRIVSLLPSATEILFAIGAGDDVVGVTFECDHPAEARDMGTRGRSVVLARYTWEQERNHLLAFYKALHPVMPSSDERQVYSP